MTCLNVRRHLSAYVDGDLESAEAGRVAGHLRDCASCAARERSLQATIDAMAELPKLSSPESMAARVLSRLEVETRGPGLALIFRPRSAARPLMVPSLLPAALVVVAVLGGALALDRFRNGGAAFAGPAADGPSADSGTEQNPLFPSSDLTLPRARLGRIVDGAGYRAAAGEGSFFLETVVARDGTVSAVTLLDGDSVLARPIVDALRRERYEPVRFQGRPVAVSVYRLVSRLEVRPPRI
jgi:hypothetical protein